MNALKTFLNMARVKCDVWRLMLVESIMSSFTHHREVTDGRVVKRRLLSDINVLSWSGGHEFEPRYGQFWGAEYFCPNSYLNQKLDG